MSNRPYPVASTAVMLALRSYRLAQYLGTDDGSALATLASRLHRLAPACQRQAVAECNGEQWYGQRDSIRKWGDRGTLDSALQDLDAAIEKGRERMRKRIAKLNRDLAPLAIEAVTDGDPRGVVLSIESTDPAHPLPSNGGTGGGWRIA